MIINLILVMLMMNSMNMMILSIFNWFHIKCLIEVVQDADQMFS